MGRESREVWGKRVARWRDSGLSAREFGDEVGVNPRTLTYWAWRLGREAGAAPAAKPRRRRPHLPVPKPPAVVATSPAPVTWLEVVTDADPAERATSRSAPAFELLLVGRTIRVPAGFDAESLRRLIAVVEAR